MQDPRLIEMTTNITKSFLTSHTVESGDVGALITTVYQSLETAQYPAPISVAPMVRQKRSYTRRAQGATVSDQAEMVTSPMPEDSDEPQIHHPEPMFE